jgi:MYXO-CTERM domain-containing protein
MSQPPTNPAPKETTDWALIVESRLERADCDLAALADVADVRHECDSAAKALAVARGVLACPIKFRRRLPVWWSGWRVERAWRALHDAEVYLTAADQDLAARMPALRERVSPVLPENDLRRRALDLLQPNTPPTRADRTVVVDAMRAAFDASDDAHAAARALRNRLFVAALLLVGLSTLLGVLGFAQPGFLPMCVDRVDAPGHLACASGGTGPAPSDVWLTQVMGAAGALIAAVVLLIRRRPSLSPYTLVGYQALIKVLLGALLAVIGVLALGSGLDAGLIEVRGQPAVLVAAVVFGYAQQLGTRLLDNYADRLLDRVRPIPRSGDS